MFNVARKEFIDHLTSRKFILILVLFLIISAYSMHGGIGDYNNRLENYKEQISQVEEGEQSYMPEKPSILIIFQRMRWQMPFLGAILAIAMGFDLITREKESRSLKSLLSHPVYRDEIINGKAVGGILALVFAIGIAFLVLFAMLLLFSIVPNMDEFWRVILFGAVTVLCLLSYFSIALMASTVSENSGKSLIYALIIFFAISFAVPVVGGLVTESMIGEPPEPPDVPQYDEYETPPPSSANENEQLVPVKRGRAPEKNEEWQRYEEEREAKARKLVPILTLFLFFLPLFFFSSAAAQIEGVEKRVEIRCDFPAQMIEAGDTAIFELLLVNHGKTATYNLRWWAYREAKNWDIKFKDGDKEVYKVLLPERSTKTVTLAVETPGDAKVGESTIHVHIGDGRITLYVKITETHKGEKGTLALTVTDKDGDSIKGATVSVYKRNNFVDYAKTTVGGKIELELEKGEYTAEIVKEGYHAKETEDFKIRIGRTTDIGIISLEQKEFYAEVSSISPFKTAMVGENPLYQIKIKNSGKADDTYRLDIEGLPEDWYCRYKETKEGKEDISELFIGSGEAKTLYLEFVPPYDVAIGEYNFTSLVQSSTGQYELEDKRSRGLDCNDRPQRGDEFETGRERDFHDENNASL